MVVESYAVAYEGAVVVHAEDTCRASGDDAVGGGGGGGGRRHEPRGIQVPHTRQ
jgi:hypothetical protein